MYVFESGPHLPFTYSGVLNPWVYREIEKGLFNTP